MKKVILSLCVIGMMATACEKTIEFNIDDRDTFLIQVCDTNSINVKVDGNQINISDTTIINNRVYGGDVNVNGGNTNTTNVINNSGSEQAPIIIPEGYKIWKIPAKTFPSRIKSHLLTDEIEDENETATWERFTPRSSEKAICFYDGNSDPTTLSYPFKNGGDFTLGKFGSQNDQNRTIYSLVIRNGEAKINIFSYGKIKRNQIFFLHEEDFVLCGLAGNDGNLPNPGKDPDDESQRTGRTLLGTDGHNIFLLVAENATISEAFNAFCTLDICPPSAIMAVGGGKSSLGLRDVPVCVEVTPNEQLFYSFSNTQP
ncbi:MAG: hypothetical protein K6E76_07340 [Patescibacteria group bacterium]|nr:hypothetical protein [Patescibacteria group bacterium]